MADKKPIRWFVPQGGESFMGIAAYYLTHEENMRQSFSQPSRSITRMLPDGTRIDYIMNDVVDCIRISPPQRAVSGRDLGKTMTWDKLPPFEEGIDNIDFSLMTEDPDVEDGYYCTVSVINGTDENGRSLSATFSIKMSTGSVGWSIKQGIRQTDETYKVDGKSATLLLGADVEGECEIIAKDGETELRKIVNIRARYRVVTTVTGTRYPISGYHWYPWFIHAQDGDSFVPYWLLTTIVTTTITTCSIYRSDDTLIDTFVKTEVVTSYEVAFSSLAEEYVEFVTDDYIGMPIGSARIITGESISNFVDSLPLKKYSYTLETLNSSIASNTDMYRYWKTSAVGMFLESIDIPYNNVNTVSEDIEVSVK